MYYSLYIKVLCRQLGAVMFLRCSMWLKSIEINVNGSCKTTCEYSTMHNASENITEC